MLLVGLFFCFLILANGQVPTTTYQIDSGPIQGFIEDGIQVFRGIPYAAPPVGNLRLRSPQPATPWNKTLECILPPSMCPQFDTDNRFLGDEDCLKLNVYVPLKPSKNPRPVFFWIYGGGYTIGDGWEFGKYDGKNLTATHDYILVSHNYRLGPLGFLSLDQLKAEDPYGSTGNYALQDQVAAMQWVQRNVHVFGGDPTRVTIFGESAGAFSVCWHLASPGSKGLFKAAIMESGTCDSPYFFVTYDRATSWSQLHTTTLGCDPASPDVATCLRSLNVTTINWVKKDLYNETNYWLPLLYPIMPWGPVIDGSPKGLPDLPLTLLQNGKGNYVPLIAGTNNNEGSIFIGPVRVIIPSVHQPMTEDDVVTVLNHFYCNNETIVNTILPYYPLSDYKSPDNQAGIMLRDWFFVCSTRRAHQAVYNVNSKLPWMYHFDYEMHWPSYPEFGDYHSSELNFVFSNPWPLDLRVWNDSDFKMATTFGIYWSNLNWNDTPNGPKETPPLTWPNWDPVNEQNIVLTVPASIENHYVGDKCPMWDQVRSLCTYCGC